MKGNISLPVILIIGAAIVAVSLSALKGDTSNKLNVNQNQSTPPVSVTSSQLSPTIYDSTGSGDGSQITIFPSPTTQFNGVQQVDWVYDNMGRCWSAWSVGSCTKKSHEGGVIIPSMRDLDHDGKEDIVCSEGDGSKKTSTITNTSDKTITINCEMYTCNSCTTGDGTYAQCDGGIDSRALRVVETINLTPGCTATCTMDGVYGTCLDKKEPDSLPVLPTPTTQNESPTTTPIKDNTPTTSRLPTTGPSNIPTQTPVPTHTPSVTLSISPTPTVRITSTLPTPTRLPTSNNPNTTAETLPLFVDYQEYTNALEGNIDENVTTYVYARGMNTAIDNNSKDQYFQRVINGIGQVRGNVKKMVMTSTLDTTDFLLENFSDEMKAAGVEYIGMDTERSVLTPEEELQHMDSTDPNVNTIAIFARKSQEKGFKSIWGPIRADGSRIINRNPQAIETMIGNECWLDGMAFQEQKQITTQSPESRIQAVSGDSTILKNISQKYNCEDFHVTMQLMSDIDRCGPEPWVKCKQLVDGVIPHIDSLGIWVNGNNRKDLLKFANALRE